MRLNELMARFAERFQLGSIGPGTDGSYALTFDGDTTLAIEQVDEEEAIFVSTAVGDFDQMDPEAATILLSANMRLRDSGGAFAALDEDSQEVVLVMRLEIAGLDVEAFEARLQAFLSHRADIVAELEDAEASSAPAPAAAESEDLMVLRL